MESADLYKAVARADIVVAAVPSTPETVGMFDRDAFSQCKHDVLFINVAREMSSIRLIWGGALQSGKLAGAGVDCHVCGATAGGRLILVGTKSDHHSSCRGLSVRPGSRQHQRYRRRQFAQAREWR
ncbi:hypothetical protein J8I82_26150 [Cupriavidus sp. LEh25]|nr:hypothetical protein [Cupriavidus sp. LEh25]